MINEHTDGRNFADKSMFYGITCLILILQTSCGLFKPKISFDDKYFVYSKMQVDSTKFEAPFFYARLDDTIYYIDSKIGDSYELMLEFITGKDTTAKLTKSIPVASYKYIIEESKQCYSKRIFKEWFNEPTDGKLACTYPKGKDTIKNKLDVGINTGIDTSIVFYGNRIKCHKYQNYSVDPIPFITTTYVEKKSFIPVMIITERFNELKTAVFDGPRGPVPNEYYILRMILDKDEIKQPFRKSIYIRE